MTASWTTSPSPPEPALPLTRPAHPGPARHAQSGPAAGPAHSGTASGSGQAGAAGPARVAVVACGALAQHVSEIAERNGWAVDVHPLPPLLHNHPERIAGQVEALAAALATRYDTVAVGYADCGTYGALDTVCEKLGIRRLRGSHCYDVFAGVARMRALLDAEPGTYVLTDFLVRSFRRTVLAELGLDRYPQLRDDYFRHYRRVVWLAQHPTDDLRREARTAADALGLPLETVEVGDHLLERELATLLP